MRDLLDPLASDVDVDDGWSAVADRLPAARRRRHLVLAGGALVPLALLLGGIAVVVSARGDDGTSRIETAPADDADPAGEVLVELPDG